ncbi:MAG: hypothetical protein K2O01_07460, partial [Bacteroidales bacterium]|nr:hypothetical protein [Bacteroidales bacterium]
MKKLRIVLSLAIGLLTPAILQTQAHAQHQIPAYAYKVQTSPGTFTDISDAPGAVKLGTDLSETADLKNMIFMATSESNATPTSKTVASNSATASATTPAFPLGFDFRIGGKPVRYFVVSALGGTYFSDSPLQVPTNAMPSTQANTNCIFAYPYQFTSSASTTTALISANIAKAKPGQAPACYLISGSEGNHVLTVQHDYLLNGKDEWIFQFKFHESSGNVEFIVKQMKADNAIAGKSERRYELGLSLVEAGANYIGGASATTDPLGSINVIAPSSMLRRIAVGQSAAVSKAKGWDSAYIVGSTVSTGRMFIDADHFPEEGRTITILHPSPCPEKAPRLSAEHYSITNETFTESSYTANLSFNTAQIPDAQTLFNSGTILAVLSDQEIPAYTLSNGTLYKKGDKIETSEL